MEKENQISIQEEKHKKNKKLPKEVSQAILKKIVYNILKAIGIIIYFAILNLAYIRMNQERLIGDIQIFSGTFLVLKRKWRKGHNSDRIYCFIIT